jgi:hypothetical protein
MPKLPKLKEIGIYVVGKEEGKRNKNNEHTSSIYKKHTNLINET